MADNDDHPLISWELFDGYVVFTPNRAISTDDAINWINAFFPVTPVKDVVWDLRRTGLSNIPTTDFHRLIVEADKYADIRGADPRTAILVEGEFDRMVVTVFTTVAEGASKIEFSMFSQMDTATDWLTS